MPLLRVLPERAMAKQKVHSAQAPEKTIGSIVLDASTLKVPNGNMAKKMLSKQWMDAKGHPEISFELGSLKDIKVDNSKNSYEATAQGTFSVKGIAKEIEAPVTLRFVEGKLAERTDGEMEGDLLVIRTNFTFSRADYNVNPGKNLDKVADEVQIDLAVVGASASSLSLLVGLCLQSAVSGKPLAVRRRASASPTTYFQSIRTAE